MLKTLLRITTKRTLKELGSKMLLCTSDSMKCFQRTIGCWLPCLCKDGVAIIVDGWAHAMLVNKCCGGCGGCSVVAVGGT